MILPSLDQRLAFFEDLVGAPEMAFRQLVIHIAGILRDPAPDANLIGGPTHFVGVRPAGFQETGGPDADHRGIADQSTVIDVFGLQTTFERNEIALPART